MTIVRRGLAVIGLSAVATIACAPAQPTLPSPILPPLEIPLAREPVVADTAATDASAPPSPPAPPSPLEAALGEWTRKTQCEEFDYHPNGGIQSFWCHRPDRISVAKVRELARLDIFTKGPHASDALKLDDASDFGHYNPDFVRWLIGKAGPSERGSAAQKATQAAYDTHLKPLAAVFWKTYVKAQADPSCFTREKTAYADRITRQKLPKDYYERWFYFMNPYFCDKGQRPANFYYDNAFDAGVDGNVTKTVIGFWLRRSIDGTLDAFAEGLKKLLAAYEPDLMTAPAHFADAAALTRTLDAAVRSVAACKDPKAKAATAHLAITVFGDGRLSARMMAARMQATPTQATCIENKFAAHQMTPFDGESLVFNRTIALK